MGHIHRWYGAHIDLFFESIKEANVKTMYVLHRTYTHNIYIYTPNSNAHTYADGMDSYMIY